VAPGPDLLGPRGPNLMAAYSGDWVLLRLESDDLAGKILETQAGQQALATVQVLAEPPREFSPHSNSASSSPGVLAGIGDCRKSFTFRVAMYTAPQARAAATWSASSKSAVARKTA
jgi:hypothetical protein